MELRKKVLIVEDSEQLQTLWKRHFTMFAPEIEALPAQTVAQALQLIDEHPDLKLVAIDGSLGNSDFDTKPVVDRLVEINFRGQIIAISSMPDVQQKLLDAGCTVAVGEKKHVPQNIIAHVNGVRSNP